MTDERRRRRDLPGDNVGDEEMQGKLGTAAPSPRPEWPGPRPPEAGSRRAADDARPGPGDDDGPPEGGEEDP
jgi:hypothetical protein